MGMVDHIMVYRSWLRHAAGTHYPHRDGDVVGSLPSLVVQPCVFRRAERNQNWLPSALLFFLPFNPNER